MAFQKGKSGNPGGAWKDKPFRDALRLELAAVGDDAKALRTIARSLIAAASEGKMDAIREVADRLDGKPAQETTVTVEDKRDATDWTRDELVAFLDDAKVGSNGAAKANGSKREPDRVH
jgi:hypothetical protein